MALGFPDSRVDEALTTELLERLGAVRRALRRTTGPASVADDLTGAQVELLRLVRDRPGLSVREAADRLRLAPNTVSTLVGQLGDAGLVRRESDTADRRVARLALTPEAARKLNARRDERTGALKRALARLEVEDLQALDVATGPLRRLAEALAGDDGHA